MFPRIELEKEDAVPAAKEKKQDMPKQDNKAKDDEITIDDFGKVKLQVVEILEAEPVPKADKLLKLTVDLGTEQREVVSGIAKNYTPDELVGKTVILVANLKAAKIRGVVSHGMILAASAGDDLKLLTVDMPAGTEVH